MLPIPTGVECSYNGVTFPVNIKTRVFEEPVTSEDNRVVKCSKITISVSGFWTQEEAGSQYQVMDATLAFGGLGYTAGDILSFSGGMFSSVAALRVDTVDGTGLILTGTVVSVGVYSVVPGNPVSTVGGTGAGATLTVTWELVRLNTLDIFMQGVRRKLSAVHGKKLVYKNKGYGTDLTINDPAGGIRDVMMGPKAGKLTWWSLGGAPDGCHGAGFTWEVTTYIAECLTFTINRDRWLAVAFTVSYDTDDAGIVTITYRGQAQIPMSLRANNTMDFNVDDVFDDLINPVSPGFKRTTQRQVSADRTTCQFTITDKQLEVAYPPDCIVVDMKHRVRQEKPYLPMWQCSISGTLRISPTAPRIRAYQAFYNIVIQRLRFIQQQVIPAGRGRINGVFRRPSILPLVMEMEEDLFKNESHFTQNFRLLNCTINDIAALSGLWRPIVGNSVSPAMDRPWDATDWTNSLADNAQAAYGLLGARFDNNQDVIINICSQDEIDGVAPEPDAEDPDEVANSAADFDDTDFDEVGNIGVSGASFEAEESWVAWECVPTRLVDHNLVRHKPLDGSVAYQNRPDPFGDQGLIAGFTDDPVAGYSQTVPDSVQQISSPSFILRLTGYGVRIGYRVNAPQLVKYGDQFVYLKTERVSETTLGVSPGVAMYRSDWFLEYIITSPPSTLPLPADPVLVLDGTGFAGTNVPEPGLLNPLG